MKMLDRTVALYDYDGSCLEKNGPEAVMVEFDYFVDRQISIGRDWADEVDVNAPYAVVW